jgi:hypothetical protein
VHIRANVRTSSASSSGGSWYCSVGMAATLSDAERAPRSAATVPH